MRAIAGLFAVTGLMTLDMWIITCTAIEECVWISSDALGMSETGLAVAEGIILIASMPLMWHGIQMMDYEIFPRHAYSSIPDFSL